MSITTRLSGTAWYGKWVTSGGTQALNGDWRSFDWTRGGKTVDSTAGGDGATSTTFLRPEHKVKFSTLATSDGSAIWDTTMRTGTFGTLTWSGGNGTANGQPKHSAPMLVTSSDKKIPYEGLEEWNVEFTSTGADVTYGAWAAGV